METRHPSLWKKLAGQCSVNSVWRDVGRRVDLEVNFGFGPDWQQ
jgi:hypothetical protein